MSANLDDFDMDAAWARRAQGDLRAFMEALAARLQAALPDRVEVTRQRDGFLSRGTHVRAIDVRGRSARFRVVFEKGTLRATTAKVVHDVVISTSEQPFPQWLAGLRAEASALAGELGSASDTLADFL